MLIRTRNTCSYMSVDKERRLRKSVMIIKTVKYEQNPKKHSDKLLSHHTCISDAARGGWGKKIMYDMF